jgi:hypothetical protein
MVFAELRDGSGITGPERSEEVLGLMFELIQVWMNR